MPRRRKGSSGAYVCPDCGISVSRKADLERHRSVHSPDRIHKCTYPGCPFATHQKHNLKPHITGKHLGLKPLLCPFTYKMEDGTEKRCKFSTADPGSLTRHRKHLHGYLPGQPPQMPEQPEASPSTGNGGSQRPTTPEQPEAGPSTRNGGRQRRVQRPPTPEQPEAGSSARTSRGRRYEPYTRVVPLEQLYTVPSQTSSLHERRNSSSSFESASSVPHAQTPEQPEAGSSTRTSRGQRYQPYTRVATLERLRPVPDEGYVFSQTPSLDELRNSSSSSFSSFESASSVPHPQAPEVPEAGSSTRISRRQRRVQRPQAPDQPEAGPSTRTSRGHRYEPYARVAPLEQHYMVPSQRSSLHELQNARSSSFSSFESASSVPLPGTPSSAAWSLGYVEDTLEGSSTYTPLGTASPDASLSPLLAGINGHMFDPYFLEAPIAFAPNNAQASMDSLYMAEPVASGSQYSLPVATMTPSDTWVDSQMNGGPPPSLIDPHASGSQYSLPVATPPPSDTWVDSQTNGARPLSPVTPQEMQVASRAVQYPPPSPPMSNLSNGWTSGVSTGEQDSLYSELIQSPRLHGAMAYQYAPMSMPLFPNNLSSSAVSSSLSPPSAGSTVDVDWDYFALPPLDMGHYFETDALDFFYSTYSEYPADPAYPTY